MENNITLYLGDCQNILKELESDSIDLIVADPPYLTTNEKWDKDEVFNEEVVKELFRVSKDSCSIYVWCGIGEKSQSLIRWFPLLKKYFHFKDLITWKKQRGIGMRKGWLYTREEILWFVKDNKQFIWNKEEQYGDEERKLDGFYFKGKNLSQRMLSKFKRYTNVWTDINEISFFNSKELKGFRKLHFTPKPLKAIERIIKLHTNNNSLILDPFLGSGTTAVACKELGRKCIGIEINEKYLEITKQRLNNTYSCLL